MISAAAASQLLTTPQAKGGAATSSAKTSSSNPFGSTSVADSALAAEKDALSRLKAVSASASASPSDLAKAKLNALKERLKMLMMMGGDPKTVAKEAAQIAKEIGQAAKDYADASGGSDSAASAEASSDTASAQQAAATAAGAAAQAGAAPAQGTSDPAAQPSASAPADAAATDPSKGDGASTDDPAATTAQAQTQAQTPAQAATQATPQTSTGGGHSSAPKSKLPDPVIEEARALEASAQALAKAALQKLKAQHKTNPDANKEQAQLDQGQKDFTAAAKEIYGNDDGIAGDPSTADAVTGYGANGSAAAPPAADTSLVSIKA